MYVDSLVGFRNVWFPTYIWLFAPETWGWSRKFKREFSNCPQDRQRNQYNSLSETRHSLISVYTIRRWLFHSHIKFHSMNSTFRPHYLPNLWIPNKELSTWQYLQKEIAEMTGKQRTIPTIADRGINNTTRSPTIVVLPSDKTKTAWRYWDNSADSTSVLSWYPLRIDCL